MKYMHVLLLFALTGWLGSGSTSLLAQEPPRSPLTPPSEETTLNPGEPPTPQLLQVHEHLWEVVDSNRQDGDRVKGAASIDAHPGLGKTTIAVAFGRDFHRRQVELYGEDSTSGDQRIPVAYLALTGTTTMWTLNSMLCRFYAHPGAESGNATQLAGRAADCVLSCDTKLVIIDDVHLLDMNRRDSRAVANHFKWLANQFPATFVFVGVGLADRSLLTEGLGLADAAYAQTGRRWTRLTVAPFEVHPNAIFPAARSARPPAP